MKLQLGRTVAFIVALSSASAIFAGTAQAQNPNTYLYIAHAASGRNMSSSTNPEFPVDISVDNICIAKGETFGEIRGPFSGVAGSFSFKITTANTGAPCTGTAIFTASVSFTEGNTYLGIITLNGSNGVVGQVYPVDLSAVPAGQGRIMVANATLQNLSAKLAFSPSGTAAGSLNVPASMVLGALPPAGMFTATVTPEGTSTVATGPVGVQIESRNVYLYVLGGSTSNNSVQVIGPKVIRDVF